MVNRIANLFPNGKIRVHSWIWVVVSGLLVVLQLFWPSRAWTTLLITVGGTWLAGFLWTLALGCSLSLRREMRYGWAQVGDHLEERYTITNHSILPALWLEVEDHSNLPDYIRGRVTSASTLETLNWRTEGTCTRRGLYTLGPTTLRSGDPLGLCSVEIDQPDSSVLLILPPVLPLPSIEIAAGGRAGEGHHRRRVALETTVSVETVRQYIPGDPLRTIHWPTSARKGELFIRQFDHMPSADWWIFLDLEARIQAGSGFESTEEHGVILAASLVDRGIRQGHRVGLVTCGEELTWLPPRRSSAQLMDILRALALVNAGERPLASLLAEALHSIRHGASIIIITPNMQADWVAPLLRLVDNGVTPTILLLDPASFGGDASTKGMGGVLTDYGIAHTMIPRELLDRPEAHPGQQGSWDWRIVGHGKAVAVRRPADLSWRRLG